MKHLAPIANTLPCPQTLCLALETTYPHLLTVMLIGASQRTPLYISRQSECGLTFMCLSVPWKVKCSVHLIPSSTFGSGL